jgi:hypothetical protein
MGNAFKIPVQKHEGNSHLEDQRIEVRANLNGF